MSLACPREGVKGSVSFFSSILLVISKTYNDKDKWRMVSIFKIQVPFLDCLILLLRLPYFSLSLKGVIINAVERIIQPQNVSKGPQASFKNILGGPHVGSTLKNRQLIDNYVSVNCSNHNANISPRNVDTKFTRYGKNVFACNVFV